MRLYKFQESIVGFRFDLNFAERLQSSCGNLFLDHFATTTTESAYGILQRLKEMDLEIIEDQEGVGKDFSHVKQDDVVILPAFGASVSEMRLLSDRGVQIVDTTCPWVAKVPPRTILCGTLRFFGYTSEETNALPLRWAKSNSSHTKNSS